jgi:hypothetical protein
MSTFNSLLENSVESKTLKAHCTEHPTKRFKLMDIINKAIKDQGPNFDLNFIDVSKIDNMEELFWQFDEFNGDISQWDVSNVEDMSCMFQESAFSGDISHWNTKNVHYMNAMFSSSEFNGDISQWDVSNVEDMKFMFCESNFNGDISHWNVSKVFDMSYMFKKSSFKGDISSWDISNVNLAFCMFKRAKYPKEKIKALAQKNPTFARIKDLIY